MILLNYGDLMIKGDSVITDHDDWVECGSMAFGCGRAITPTSGGKDRDTSTPSFSEITFEKLSDVASVDLMIEAAGGKKVDTAIIHLLNTSEDAVQVYMTIELTNPMISSYSVSSEGDRPKESFSINYTHIKYGYNKFEEGGKIVKISPKTWDLQKNKKV